MLSVKDKIHKIHKTQQTIDALLESGILAKDAMHFEDCKKKVSVDILFQKDATVGLGSMQDKGVMQEHQHFTRHYLICVSGRFIIKFDGAVRVLGVGDCVSIPPGIPHTTQCVYGGRLIFVNVPADNSWGEVTHG